MDLVKLTNTGDTPVEFRGNTVSTLDAGKSRIVTWEFATMWLGRPDIDDPKERKTAYDLVRLQWGYMDGVHTPATWQDGGGFTPEGAPISQAPSIKVTVLGDGSADSEEQVFMLIEDPDRLNPMPGMGEAPLPDNTSDIQVMRAYMAKQEQELAKLTALVASMAANPNPELTPADETALATVQSADAAKASSSAGAGASTELPKPKATRAGAADGPLQVK